MAQVNVLNMNGEVVSTLSLKDEVFGQEWNDQIIYDVVKAQTAAMREGSSQTKNRAAVRGGGRKPYRQKGTGHARQGSIRAPHYRGGGHVFELHPRDYSFSVNRKVREQALRIALSDKVKNGKLIVLDEIKFDAPKTASFVKMYDAIKAEGKAMIVLNEFNENLELASRNLPYIWVSQGNHTSVYDILDSDTLILSKKAVSYYEEELVNE